MRFRTFASALAAGALVLTPLATAATAASASPAASASAEASTTGKFDCKYATYALEYAPTIDGSLADGKISLAFSKFPGITGVPASITVKTVAATVTATIGGQEVTLKGSVTPATAAPLANGYDVPNVTVDAPAGVKGGELTITGLSFDLVANAFGREMAAAIGCTMPAPVKVDIPAPPTFECKYNAWSLPYSPTITAKGDKGKVEVTMTDFSGIAGVPAFVTVGKVATEATATYGGKTITLAGEHTPATPAPLANGFAVPTMTADRPAGVNGGELTITALGVKITALGSENAIACSMAAPVTVAVTPEVIAEPAPEPKPVPVVKGASTAKVSKVTYSKKTKKAKVAVAVTGKKGKATGKATIVIKRGKATVAKKVVTLKNGKASWTSKKITKKGTYKVTVKYAGSKVYKASKTSKAKSFKIKK